MEIIVAKGEIARFVQFLLLLLCFQKSCLLQRRQKASIWGKGLRSCGRKIKSNFSSFHDVFKSHLLQECCNAFACWKGLTYSWHIGNQYNQLNNKQHYVLIWYIYLKLNQLFLFVYNGDKWVATLENPNDFFSRKMMIKIRMHLHSINHLRNYCGTLFPFPYTTNLQHEII